MVVKLVLSADVLRGGVLAGALSTADLMLGMAEGMVLMVVVAAMVLAWGAMVELALSGDVLVAALVLA